MRPSSRLFSFRWLRAVDIPSRKPVIYGYEPDSDPKEFEAFSSRDSERIERAWQRKNASLGSPMRSGVAVEEDGLLCVDLNTMLCSPTYWDGPAFKVCRSLCFEMLGNNRILPVDAQIEQELEQKWANGVEKFELNMRGSDGSEQTMIAEAQGDKIVLREKDSWLSAFRRRYLFRGIPKEDEMEGSKTRTGQAEGQHNDLDSRLKSADNEQREQANSIQRPQKQQLKQLSFNSQNSSSKREVNIRPEYRPRKINHLVFCVHGIGQLLSVRFEQVNFIKDVDSLRQTIDKFYASATKKKISGPLGQNSPDKDSGSATNSTPEEGSNPLENSTLSNVLTNLKSNVTSLNSTSSSEASTSSKEQVASSLLHSPKSSSPSTSRADASDIQVLPVLWRHKLNNKINGLEPSQLFGTANLAAEAVLDFVMYGSPQQKHNIMNVAGEEMRRMFKEFCEFHPEFAENPRVSIIGHSLGAVISFDLVCRSDFELGFEVQNLFTLGSPLGVLGLIENDHLNDTGRAHSLYNIMRLSDPVATRLEPLVSRNFVEFGPRPMPGGATNLLQQARELTGDLVSQGEFLANKASNLFQLLISTNRDAEPEVRIPSKPASDKVHIPELQKFNRHGRLDFSVQETLDISLILGLAGHLMYLDNPDVVMFILKEILRK